MHIKDIKNYNDFVEAVSEIINEAVHFPQQWVTGGISGGSPFNNSKGNPISPDSEPEDIYIPEILKIVYPEHTREHVEKLNSIGSIWHIEAAKDAGNYGDFTEYTTRKLKIENFFEQLKETLQK